MDFSIYTLTLLMHRIIRLFFLSLRCINLVPATYYILFLPTALDIAFSLYFPIFFVLHWRTPFLLLFLCTGPYFLLFPSFFLFSGSRSFLSLHWISCFFEYFSLALPPLPYSGSRMNVYNHSRPHIQCTHSRAETELRPLPITIYVYFPLSLCTRSTSICFPIITYIQCIYSSAKLSCHTFPVTFLFQPLCIGY